MIEGIQTISSNLPGPTVTIMGGVHGDEPSGVIAIKELLSTLSIKRGKAHFIVANLKALELKVRQTDMNMNRAFKAEEMLTEPQRVSYERQRALQIMPYLDESDALLDVHSSMTPNSTPFIICEPHSYPITSYLPFSIVSSGWDIIEPGGTDYYVNKHGGKGVCIECGTHLDKNGPIIARDSILIFLILMGLLDGKVPKKTQDQKKIYAHQAYLTVENFKLARKFSDFEEIEEGTLIGTDGDLEVKAKEDGVIIFARDVSRKKDEAFILARIV